MLENDDRSFGRRRVSRRAEIVRQTRDLQFVEASTRPVPGSRATRTSCRTFSRLSGR